MSDVPTNSVSQSPSVEATSQSHIDLAIVVAAFLLILASISRSEPLQSANDRSRWCTVWSLVERGTYQIDEIDQQAGWSTIDKVRHRSNVNEPYHFYSSKPPLFPTMVAGLYWLEKHTLGYNLTDHPRTVTRILLVLINAVPMLFAMLSFRTSLQLLHVSRTTRSLVLFAAGFGSMLNPFLTTLNNHTPAAVCLLFCLSAMIRIQMADPVRPRDLKIVGFTAALTCCFELPAALFGVVTFLFVVRRDWRAALQWYVPSALLPLAAFFVTNWICTGGIKPFYAYYGTDKYVYVHEGVPSYWTNPRGIDANSESPGVYLFHCILGHHGILSLTPIFLLTLVGWVFCRGDSQFLRVGRPVMRIGWMLSLAILAFYLSRTQNYNYGGNSSALRWMLWLTPFWWYGMVPAMELALRSAKGWGLAILFIAASTYSAAYSLGQPWRPGWIFHAMKTAGWIDYSTRTPPFDPPRHGLLASLPNAGAPPTSWFGSNDAHGQQRELQMRNEVVVNGKPATVMTVTSTCAEDVRIESLVVFSDRLQQAADVQDWAMSLESPDSLNTNVISGGTLHLNSDQVKPLQTSIATLLRGLPSARTFNAESPRYLRYTTSAGEKTAILCERGAAQVVVELEGHGRCRYRCDALWNSELPYGLAQWKITITDARGKAVRNELWTASRLPE